MNALSEPQGNGLPEPQPGLSLPELERVYDELAASIDAAGAKDSERFLVKLALLSAQALGNGERFEALIAAALKDL